VSSGKEKRWENMSYGKLAEGWESEQSALMYSVGGLILSNAGKIAADYWLSEIYDDEIVQAHCNKEIYIHDLSRLTGYCTGWSLRKLVQEGIVGDNPKNTFAPARHLPALFSQIIRFLKIMQSEWSGPQALFSFDTYLAPFVKKDELTYTQVKTCIESFIREANRMKGWGTQLSFSNIILDWAVPEELAQLPAMVGGKEIDFTYQECKPEMDMINHAFLEIMMEEQVQDIQEDMEFGDVQPMCARLRINLRQVREKSKESFGTDENTGSIGIVNINIPKMAYVSQDEEEFYYRLDEMMDIAARALKIKCDVITRLLEEGLYPYTKRYLGDFQQHFSTIGAMGLREAQKNAKWLNADFITGETQEFTKEVLNHMEERVRDYEKLYGSLYNLEVMPIDLNMI